MSYRLPAEWEPQEFVLLAWPNETTDWAPYLEEIRQTVAEMVRAIVRHEKVLLLSMFKSDVPDELRSLPNVYVAELPNNDTWARDFGPIVLKSTPPVAFNGWGEKFHADWDNMIPMKLWGCFGFLEEADYEDHQDFVLEGGSIDTDGEGTLFTTSQCLLAPHRNQPLTQEQVEAELKRRLRVSRVVWLDHGTLVGDDTDGHIDTIVRCAPDDTLVYVGCDDEGDEQYADFLALEQQLKTLRTASGEPYRLLRLPMPDAIYEEQEETAAEGASAEPSPLRLPATYANFLVINDALLVPTYAQPEKDAEAMSIIGQAYPGRELVPIDARTIIRQHGSVHCLTMQVPR